MIVDRVAEVLANIRLSDDCNVLVLGAPDLARHARPGQFVMLKPEAGALLLRRPYSVFEIVRDGSGEAAGFSILSQRVGVGSGLIYAAAPGDRMACLGPLGRPFTIVEPPAAAILVAGGVGLAPFPMLAEALVGRGVSTTLLYGARTASELHAIDRFEHLPVAIVLATEDGSRGVEGRVTVPLERELAAAPPDRSVMVYACGPEPMLEAVSRLAGAYNRSSELAMERMMGCGLGGCYSCVVKLRRSDGSAHYVRSCLEGPILRGEDVVWEP